MLLESIADGPEFAITDTVRGAGDPVQIVNQTRKSQIPSLPRRLTGQHFGRVDLDEAATGADCAVAGGDG